MLRSSFEYDRRHVPGKVEIGTRTQRGGSMVGSFGRKRKNVLRLLFRIFLLYDRLRAFALFNGSGSTVSACVLYTCVFVVWDFPADNRGERT